MVDGVTGAPEVGASRAAGRDHAVVVGASMARLLAARVLADHFARVTVVERDRPPADPSPRGGVPQGRHVHVLLMRGKQLLEGFFPGLDTELAEAGAPRMDMIASPPRTSRAPAAARCWRGSCAVASPPSPTCIPWTATW